jgi:3-phenylpropionate/trans-cinnamate dioxygenase ferredoxin component
MTTWLTVARASEVPPRRVTVVSVGDHDVALCNVDGSFYAIDDLCTHDFGPLDQGELDDNEIECPRHGARFDVRTGAVTQMPAFQPVATHDVRVEGDAVQVGVEHR